MKIPSFVKIVEVGPRDGLQNEPTPIDAATKIELIDRLSDSGLSVIEAAAMVNPDKVPQMADADTVYRGIQRAIGTSYPILVPNQKGMERALAANADEIALFTSASEAFNQRNINCSIAESIQRFEPVIESALDNNIRIRCYISCAFGCPTEEKVDFGKVAHLAELLTAMGCSEISLGDTTGEATPLLAQEVIGTVADRVATSRLAVHFHDTRGQALANIFASLQLGISTVDASIAGLGGCPFAKSSSGNVATEDLVYMLHGMGVETGVNLASLIETGRFICDKLGRTNQSKVGAVKEGVDDEN